MGMVISIVLLFIATWHYPGGSQVDKNSVGYDWKNNYISNLFGKNAVNGSYNSARFWAVGGMIFLSASFAMFFVEFSKRIPVNSASKIIKYVGAGGMFFTFLIATPLHDIMVTIASTMFLIGMFYITIFVLKSKLHLFKLLCIICLLVFYYTLYLYGSASLKYLPIMQKITFATSMALILGLAYFTKKEDFQHIKAGKQKVNRF